MLVTKQMKRRLFLLYCFTIFTFFSFEVANAASPAEVYDNSKKSVSARHDPNNTLWICYMSMQRINGGGLYSPLATPPTWSTNSGNNIPKWIRKARKKGLSPQDCFTLIDEKTYGSQASSIERNTAQPARVRSSYEQATPLQSVFNGMSKADRKLIQSNLKNTRLYSSTLDGLYGRGTAKALEAYNKEYLGNADLSKAANVEALFADILKELPSIKDNIAEEKTGPTAPNPQLTEVHWPKLELEVPSPKLADLQAAYDVKDYPEAKQIAELLAIEGNAEAQFLLGKMYADGLGALQISKTAHMWFNIASLNGSAGAVAERNSIAETMSSEAVEEAQELALLCIQSKYSDCGLSAQPKQSQPQSKPKEKIITDGTMLSREFKTQSVLKRKQLQYALKKLGVYNSSVDGLWGNRTSTAFSNYIKINDLSASSGEAVFASILSKVDVPTAFASPKKRVAPRKQVKTNRNTNTAGLRAIVDSPPVTGVQAKAICEPQAKMASRNAGSSSSGSTRTRCTGYGYSINCRSSSGPSSAAEGLLLGLASGLEKRSAREDAMAACLAQYGWKK